MSGPKKGEWVRVEQSSHPLVCRRAVGHGTYSSEPTGNRFGSWEFMPMNYDICEHGGETMRNRRTGEVRQGHLKPFSSRFWLPRHVPMFFHLLDCNDSTAVHTFRGFSRFWLESGLQEHPLQLLIQNCASRSLWTYFAASLCVSCLSSWPLLK